MAAVNALTSLTFTRSTGAFLAIHFGGFRLWWGVVVSLFTFTFHISIKGAVMFFLLIIWGK